MTLRLTSDFWVRAYLRRLEIANIPAYVTAHGEPHAGAVMVKCATLDGRATLWQRSFDLTTGARKWVVLAEGPEAEVDASIRRQRGFDPDLWVIEIESRDGRTLLDEEGLSD
ncbi:DUF1491 family protein [Sinirhodobacter ferrireducens]|uniref:DUF1491 family protein n=1 Tax=Paenirhodobacter ferrireducens TaxID=1215032 RepID=A0A443L881_9RHOB|nr:DUF1491 family protein [Sinirhodobacter ferrireducens]RWR45437.1 DUF1491 family protein [Sinirhodobacter ferrireducens]